MKSWLKEFGEHFRMWLPTIAILVMIILMQLVLNLLERMQ